LSVIRQEHKAQETGKHKLESKVILLLTVFVTTNQNISTTAKYSKQGIVIFNYSSVVQLKRMYCWLSAETHKFSAAETKLNQDIDVEKQNKLKACEITTFYAYTEIHAYLGFD